MIIGTKGEHFLSLWTSNGPTPVSTNTHKRKCSYAGIIIVATTRLHSNNLVRMERALIRAKTERQERDNSIVKCLAVFLCGTLLWCLSSLTHLFPFLIICHKNKFILLTDHRSSSSCILTSFPQFNNSGIRSLRNYFVTLGMIVHDFRRLRFGQDSCTFLITSYRMLLSMVSWPK